MKKMNCRVVLLCFRQSGGIQGAVVVNRLIVQRRTYTGKKTKNLKRHLPPTRLQPPLHLFSSRLYDITLINHQYSSEDAHSVLSFNSP